MQLYARSVAYNPAPPPPPRPSPEPVLVEPQPEDKNRSWVWVLFLGLIAAGVWSLTQMGGEKAASWSPHRVGVARSGRIERSLRVTGMTQALRFSYLVAPRLRGSRHSHGDDFSLTLEKMLAPGSRVKKGDLVAGFDRQYMLVRLEDYKSDVVQQKLNLERLRANLSVRRAYMEQRIRSVKGAMEKAALDLKTAPVRSAIAAARLSMNLEEAKARYAQTLQELPLMEISEQAANRRYEIDVIQAERELAKAEKNLSDMSYHASMDGVLVLQKTYRGSQYVEIQEGDLVGSGSAFAEVVDTSQLVVDASMNQVDGENIKNGARARVHFDAFPELEIPARIVSIAAVTKSGYRPTYRRDIGIRLMLEQNNERIIPNLSAHADIVVEAEDNTVVLPRECVFLEGDKAFAVVEAGGGWEKRPVELGLANNTEIAVQSGVKEGERLAAELPELLRKDPKE